VGDVWGICVPPPPPPPGPAEGEVWEICVPPTRRRRSVVLPLFVFNNNILYFTVCGHLCATRCCGRGTRGDYSFVRLGVGGFQAGRSACITLRDRPSRLQIADAGSCRLQERKNKSWARPAPPNIKGYIQYTVSKCVDGAAKIIWNICRHRQLGWHG
jgi:hypothetical protein